MSYQSESDFACSLLNAIEYLVEIITEHDEENLYLTSVLFHFLYGWVISIPVECPECGEKFGIQTEEPVCGLDELLDELEDCIKILAMEMIYEIPDEPTYDI